MNATHLIEEQQYSASAHFDRFDGFDRGDTENEDRDQGCECIGRMQAEFGGKVEIFHMWNDGDDFYLVTVTNTTFGNVTTHHRDTEAEAKSLGRWFLNGCPD